MAGRRQRSLCLRTKNLHINELDFRDYHLLLIEHAEQISAMTDDVAERVHKIGGTTLHSISDILEPQCLENNNEEPFCAE
jgi:starvation-inducible DNA-binding protein